MTYQKETATPFSATSIQLNAINHTHNTSFQKKTIKHAKCDPRNRLGMLVAPVPSEEHAGIPILAAFQNWIFCQPGTDVGRRK